MPCCLRDDYVKEFETKHPPRMLNHLDTCSEVHSSRTPSCDTPAPVPLDQKKATYGNKKKVSKKPKEKRALRDKEHKTGCWHGLTNVLGRKTKQSQVSTPNNSVNDTAKESVTKLPTSDPLNTCEVMTLVEQMPPLGKPSLQTIANGIGHTPNPALLCLLLLKLLSTLVARSDPSNTPDVSSNTDTLIIPGNPPNRATVAAKPSNTYKRATAESRSMPSLPTNIAGAANTNGVVCVPPSATSGVEVKDKKMATRGKENISRKK